MNVNRAVGMTEYQWNRKLVFARVTGAIREMDKSECIGNGNTV